MSPAGWLTLIAAIGGATWLFVWCLWKVLATPGADERIHSQADVEPPDQKVP